MAIDWTELVKTYRGQWVALKDDGKTVVANGRTVKAVIRKAESQGEKDPTLFKVPTKIALHALLT